VRIPTRDNHKIPGDQFDCLSNARDLDPALAIGNDVERSSVVGYAKAPWRAEFWAKVQSTPKMNRLKEISEQFLPPV
jgi:hypothetical protein